MPAWPDAAAVQAFLARARRRRAVVALLEGAAIGALIALAALAFSRDVAFLALASAGAVSAGAVARAWLARRGGRALPAAVEARAPECRNLLVTAAELLDAPDGVRPDIGARVCRDAARLVAPLQIGRLFPARRAWLSLAGSAAAWLLAAWIVAAPARVPAAMATGDGSGPAGPAILGVSATITPPAYADRETSTIDDASEVETLAGSRVRLTISAAATRVRLATNDEARTLERDANEAFETEIVADATQVVSIEPIGPDGTAGSPRLVTIVAQADHDPRVRITAPGRDLFLSDPAATLTLGLEADDDLGLASIALTYTRVTGSGENFEFVTGEVPLSVTRASERSWTAAGTLALAALALEPGDMVVYRGLAADRRPGTPPVESDAFIVEILAPGEAAAGGFEIDDQQDRYALSQRMVLIKTERLAARRGELATAELLEQARALAAEQRQVRAEFIFMMGGELGEFGENSDPFMLHEEDEAHAEGDIAAGRLVNEGRSELTRAVRAMSRAATALASAELDAALPAEREAVEALQNAFAKSRYILRTLSDRESIDLERRLSGALSGVARGGFTPDAAGGDEAAGALRRILADVIALSARREPEPAHVIAVARTVLALDPESEAIRNVAGSLTDAARAIEGAEGAAAALRLHDAATALAALARARVSTAPAVPPGSRSRLLTGAQADIFRGGGRP